MGVHGGLIPQTYNFISYNNHRSYIRKISTPCAAFGFSTQQWGCHSTQSPVDASASSSTRDHHPILEDGKASTLKTSKIRASSARSLFSLPGFSKSADQHTAVATVRAA